MSESPRVAFAGAYGATDTVARRVRTRAATKIDEPRLVLAGAAAVSRTPAGTWCAVAGHADVQDVLGRRTPGLPAEPALAIATAYERLGEEVLDLLRGVWILALWHEGEGRGLLARDALGGRSLHYARTRAGLVFGEDARDVVALSPTSPGPDRAAVCGWIEYGLLEEEATLYAGVRRLPSGGLLRLVGDNVKQDRYWRVTPPPKSALIADPAEGAASLREATDVAVARAVRAGAGGTGRHLGVMLSGGLDSSTVAAAAVRVGGAEKLIAYSGVFPDHPAADEEELIRALVGHLALQHETFPVRRGRAIPDGLRYLEVWGLPPVSANHFIWRQLKDTAVASGIRTMLTGEGGDELFVRLPGYYLADLLLAVRLRRAWGLAARYPGAWGGPRARLRVLRNASRALAPAGVRHRLGFDPWPELLRSADAGRARVVGSEFAWVDRPGPRWWRHQSQLATTMRERFDIAGEMRRDAALSGLEVLHPLMHDRDLVEVSLRLHPSLHFDATHDRPIARAAVRDRLPRAIVDRRGKSHFTDLPTDAIQHEELETVRALLSPRAAHVREYVDPRALDRLVEQPVADVAVTNYVWMMRAWRLAMVESWLDHLS